MKTENKSWRRAGNIVLLLVFLNLMIITGWTESKLSSRIPPSSLRPANWAQPLSLHGLKNFYMVNENLYRGARPTVEGFKSLKGLGVKTIVNLEAFHTDEDEIAESGTGFNYYPIRMTAWNIKDKNIMEFLKISTDPENFPVFVHCQHGSDRTGTAIAIYRIIVDGWTKEEAIDELKNGGYGFHFIWQNIVEYLQEVNVENFERDATEISILR